MDTDTKLRIAAFEDQQGRIASRIEAHLARLLVDATGQSPDRLQAAIRHATLGGGKRFRAFLVMESTRLVGASEAAALDIAAALECLHAYSLVHDDLPAMDNDQLRRGMPTVWCAFDEWTAILAGDALLTLAFEIIAGAQGASLAAKVELSSRLAACAGRAGMVGGQVLDLEADKLGQPQRPTISHIDRLQTMKTGALITFACEAGPILAGSPSDVRQTLVRYSQYLGLAFQISDDLLDVQGDAETVGKAVGKDAAQGKATHVSLQGIDGARERLRQVVSDAVQSLAGFNEGADALRGAALFMLSRRS